jgi:hypothetical protein
MFTLWVRQENPFSRSMRARKALTVQVFSRNKRMKQA